MLKTRFWILAVPSLLPLFLLLPIALLGDGKPLSKANGPYETIEEDANQRGRWVRHADKIALVRALPRLRPRIGMTGEKSRTPGKLYLVGGGDFFCSTALAFSHHEV
jgi:hypothetical protein